MTAQAQDASAAPAKTVAAIDIGSNLVRMTVAEVMPDGRFEVLEQLQRAVRLGQDTFRNGRIAGRTMRAAAAVLRDYRRILDLYQVGLVRAVATSAVREAANTDTFLDRMFMATGLDVEVIDTSEESRLTVSAVRHEVGGAFGLNRDYALIAEVGGGSALLTILHGGEIVAAQSLRLGSIRLQETLAAVYEPPDRMAKLLQQQIANTISVVRGSLPLAKASVFVAVGADARFAADQVGKPAPPTGLRTVNTGNLDALVKQCRDKTLEQLAKAYGLAFTDAETLSPALLVYQALLHAVRARRMIVSRVSMRDGLLLDLAHKVTGREDETLSMGVAQSAMGIAEKYKVDLAHARKVADLADRLFDELQAEHGLGPRERLLLRAAALLHEVGGFVSSRAHHKHSYYLIANAEIFGLTRSELAVVALIARYHRRSPPKPSHVEYTSLPRETRTVVSKLAALLRVADALDNGHAQQVQDIRCVRQDEDFVIYVPGATDLALERAAMRAKGDLFEDVYGMRVRLEEAQPAMA